MEISFLGQGLNPARNKQAGEAIKTALTSGEYTSVKIFVAFLSKSGLNAILTELNAFRRTAGHSVRVFVGVDLHGTSKEALDILIADNIETYIVYSPNSLIYHPKIYLFEGPTYTMAIVGSSNLTTTGLFQNIEASVCIKFANDHAAGTIFLNDLVQHYDGVINATHSSCKRLTAAILTLLIDNKIVLPESVIRTKRNKSDGEYTKRDAVKNAQLLETFGKIKEVRPASGYTRRVTGEVRAQVSDTESTVVYEEMTLEGGTLWVETKAMTGAARNILDLSMSGMSSARAPIDGSVAFFGIDITARTIETDITIIHGGKSYSGNTIKFPQGTNANMTWRLQLKGESADGDTLKTISRPTDTFPGGFVNKILVFKRTAAGVFEMAILPADTIDKLKEKSSVWGTNGNNSSSKAYGIIAP